MGRKLHRYPALIAGTLIFVLALSGMILSVFPALERAGAPMSQSQGLNVADVAGKIVANYPGVEQIKRTPSGKIVVFYFSNDVPASVSVNPLTGKKISDFQPSGFRRWVTRLHRALLLDNKGRAAAGITAFAFLVLSFSGLTMVAKRQGGWRRFFARARGTGSQRLHVVLSRVAVFGFLLSSSTAIYMSLATFGFVNDGMSATPRFPQSVDGGAQMAVADIPALQTTALTDLRQLSFPYPDDPTDVFTLTTASGSGYIDQATGQMITFLPNNTARKIYEFIFMLHTGQGLWWLGLVLGMAVSVVPILAGTGVYMWWRNWKATPRFSHNVSPAHADTVILVGSESNSTWGFARSLHDAMTKEGFKTHTTSMNRLRSAHTKAKRMFILTATYGDGEAPASAKTFLKKLEKLDVNPDMAVGVLGFGDRQFPQFCRFARDVSDALRQNGWADLMPLDMIDRQSAQEFARWGRDVGAVIGTPLTLDYTPQKPRTNKLRLISRTDYGAEVQAPTTVFRFGPSSSARKGWVRRMFFGTLPRFRSGDLAGVVVPGDPIARYYSLASSSSGGFLEICVRKQPGGLCSGYLHGLSVGDEIEAFIKPNADFHPQRGRKPIILIGAGTGIGPLTGFIRENSRQRSMHLYFGARDPSSDFLYESDLAQWLEDKRLTTLNSAFSRVADKKYVQDHVARDADKIVALIREGAQIMVCGGRGMAQGVMDALDAALEPAGLDVVTLKAEGRYVEDTY